MTTTIQSQNKIVLVVGDLMLDEYLYGKSSRLSPEAPVAVVSDIHSEVLIGGAGNVALNLIALGCDTKLYGVVGDDHEGRKIAEVLEESGVDSSYLVTEQDRCTTKKTRIISGSQQLMRVDREEVRRISHEGEVALLSKFEHEVVGASAVILSDYGKGVLSNYVVSEAIRMAADHGIKVFIDPKGSDYTKYAGAFCITPNLKEAGEALGSPINTDEHIFEALTLFSTELAIERPVITLSERGIGSNFERTLISPAVAKQVYDVTGAGDTVIAALAVAYINKKTWPDCLEFANQAAGIAVSRTGAVRVSMSDILASYQFDGPKGQLKMVKSLDELRMMVSGVLEAQAKVVFFESTGIGLSLDHLAALRDAKMKSACVIVLLCQTTILSHHRHVKDATQLVNDAASMFSALEPVDYVYLCHDIARGDLIEVLDSAEVTLLG